MLFEYFGQNLWAKEMFSTSHEMFPTSYKGEFVCDDMSQPMHVDDCMKDVSMFS